MQKGYEHFEREISTYCDKNIINDALFSNYKHKKSIITLFLLKKRAEKSFCSF